MPAGQGARDARGWWGGGRRVHRGRWVSQAHILGRLCGPLAGSKLSGRSPAQAGGTRPSPAGLKSAQSQGKPCLSDSCLGAGFFKQFFRNCLVYKAPCPRRAYWDVPRSWVCTTRGL